MIVAPGVAVPQSYYRHFAGFLAEHGYSAWTFDYRGVAASPAVPSATAADWALQDLPAVIERAASESPTVDLIGHSFGGQVAGMCPHPERIRSMVTIVAQSGHWRLQGGSQPPIVAFLGWVLLPLLAWLFRTVPFQALRFGVDVPAGAVRQWAQWVRHPDYLFGDSSLPTERYAAFSAPVLAFSIDDDHWGTARSVDNMMAHYPNVERRHLRPQDCGMKAIGHLGAFRPEALAVWTEILDWLRRPISQGQGTEASRGNPSWVRPSDFSTPDSR